jgi:putative redox protein
MVLAGMGGCTAFDVVTILKKARQRVTACHAELSRFFIYPIGRQKSPF